jgi:uncharacterized membrane protein
MKLKTILVTLGVGAGLMYFLDPQQGKRRRALIQDRANRWINNLDESLEVGMEDIRNQARGVLSELTAKFSREDTPDWLLEERVRAVLGRVTRHSRLLDIRSDRGHVIISGPALRVDRDEIMKSASRTRGVSSVEDELRVYETEKDFPSMQIPRTGASAAAVQQGNWSPATRLLSGIGGSLLTLYGLKRKGLSKPLLSTAGLILTTRSMTNKDPRELLGIGGEGAIKIRKAINIDAPIDEVYQFWRNFENFKLFMEHVKDITVQGDVSTWKVAGPAGTTVEYKSHITRDVPNESIAWETLPDSQVHHTGFVHFDPNNTGGTRVSVQMDYTPPAGELGHVVAELFGVDPRHAMNEDLIRLKTLLEEGRTSSTRGTATLGEDVEL